MDMPAEEFRRAGHEVIDWIADYLADPGRYPALPNTKPGDLTAMLPGSAPETGESIDRIFEEFKSLIVPNCAPWNHPRFHAFFSVSSSGPGILAEALIAT